MKPPPYLQLLAFVVLSLLLVSCATPAENERLARIGDIALRYAEQRGAISPQDAAAVREAGQIILTKDVPAVVVTSGK